MTGKPSADPRDALRLRLQIALKNGDKKTAEKLALQVVNLGLDGIDQSAAALLKTLTSPDK